MSAQYAYFYLMGNDGIGVGEAVSDHVAYWRGLDMDDYIGGPFEDRTGGLITFRAEGIRRAKGAVASDPFVALGLVKAYWLKGWLPE